MVEYNHYMPCSICGSTTKSPNSPGHLKTNIHKSALRKQSSGHQKLPATNKKSSGDVNQKIDQLIKQMEYVIPKLNQLETKILELSSGSNNRNSLLFKDLSYEILSVVPHQRSITIDEIINSLPKYSWELIHSNLARLVDHEKLDVADGRSSKKLHGKFGRVLRR